MERWEKKSVLYQMTARPMDFNRICPDCICTVALTEDGYLSVLEDEYNGCYTAHFRWRLEQILAVEVGTHQHASGAQAEDKKEKAMYNSAGALLATFGGVLVWKDKGQGRKGQKQYLKITYEEEDGMQKELFFEDFEPRKAKKLTQAIHRYKQV